MATSLAIMALISAEGVPKVAVLPFGNISGDTSDNWLCLGFAETMSGKLSHVPNLMVVERVYVGKILEEQHFQEGAVVNLESAVRVGSLLGAQKVIIGSFQHFGELVKASAKLVDVETGQVEAAAEAEGYYNEVLDLQDALANELVERICPEAKEKIVEEEEEPKPSIKPIGVDEYNMGFMDGQSAVNNDAAMYGVYACLGQTLLPPLGVIPVVMAMSSEPGVSGYPRMNTQLYMQGYYQGTQTKKASVKSARTRCAIGGCLLGSAITPGILALYFALVLS